MLATNFHADDAVHLNTAAVWEEDK